MTTNEHAPKHGFEKDIPDSLGGKVWGFFFFVTAAIFIIVAALTMYFKYEVDKEHFKKVGSRESREQILLKKNEDGFLGGNQAARTISIDDAMDRFVRQQR